MRMLGLKLEHTPKGQYIDTYLTADYGKPSINFIASKEIENALKQTGFSRGDKFGHTRTKYIPQTKTMKLITYYPMPKLLLEFFQKQGIGAWVDRLVAHEVRKRFGKIEKVVHMEPLKPRIAQLERRGHTIEEIRKGIKYSNYLKGIKRKTMRR